jgi:hypothetical protein
LAGLQRGTLANDAAENVPYGSPDTVELAAGLASSLLRRPTAGARELLSAGVLRDLRALAARGDAAGGGAGGGGGGGGGGEASREGPHKL